MSESSEKLKEIRRALAEQLRTEGFSAGGNTFRRQLSEVVQLVSLQRSRSSTMDTIRFTLNIGVASLRLLAREETSPRECTIEDCHWRTRPEHVAPSGMNSWWIVDSDTQLQPIVEHIKKVTASDVLPALDSLTTDADLVALWLAGTSPGLTNAQRLIYSSVLTRALNMADEAETVLHELKDLAKTKSLPLLRMHLAEIGETEDA